jgi:O-antigen ligase
VTAVTLLAIIFIPEFHRFVFEIVLKGNNMAGRDELNQRAMEYFRNGTIVEKLFGHGIAASRAFFEKTTGHGSVHNAYLQVLVYYGVVGLIFVVAFLVTQIITCVKEMKRNRFVGVVSLGLVLASALIMTTTTSIIFNSSIDSFFVTMFMILVPKYVRNSVNSRRFDEG